MITVPTGQTLTDQPDQQSLPPGVPTSLVIVGQLGGGLGTTPSLVDSPPHAVQTLTWPAAGNDATNTPPEQGKRVQSFSSEVAVGATAQLTWTAANLRPGTYLFESGTHPSIQGPMGLYGILVVTAAPAGVVAGTAYPGVSYNADVPLLLSEIDPVQNAAVAKAVTLPGFSETTVWSGQPGGCGHPATANSGNCYPPAVNYSPRYYLVNGVAFNRTSPSTSLFAAAPASGVTGNVLVRIVNAGLRMHVPSIVGSVTTPRVVPTGVTAAPVAGFSLVAEDGNPLPGVTRVQSEVFMAAGKTYDVMINVPAGTVALPFFDRQLSLSGNATSRDAGMLAYIGVNGATLPSGATAVTAVANPDVYNSLISGKTLTVSDPAKGVIANDANVYGVTLVGTLAGLTLNTNGTFAYTGGPAVFTYCANGTVTGTTCSSGITATVTLGGASIEGAGGIHVNPDAYTSNVATTLSITSPGVLGNDVDDAGYPLTAELVAASGATVTVNPDGSFTATVPAHAGSVTPSFTYRARNSQGTLSTGTATVGLTFLAPSNLSVTLVDGLTKVALAEQDYRWIIEEDRTFFIDPKCQTNPLPAGCPTVNPAGAPATLGRISTPATCRSWRRAAWERFPAKVASPSSVRRRFAILATAFAGPVPQRRQLIPARSLWIRASITDISVLPGDAMDPGHAMGGAQIAADEYPDRHRRMHCGIPTGERDCGA